MLLQRASSVGHSLPHGVAVGYGIVCHYFVRLNSARARISTSIPGFLLIDKSIIFHNLLFPVVKNDCNPAALLS